MKKNITVLYVEDNPDERRDRMFVLSSRYLNVIQSSNGQEGIELYKKYLPDLIITDIKMSPMDGLTMVENIRKLDSKIPAYILTSHNDIDYAMKAINWNYILYVQKDTVRTNSLFEKSLEKIELYLGKEKNSSIYSLFENTYFDVLNHTLVIDKYVIPLTNNETTLLKLFCENGNQIVTYFTIQQVVWGEENRIDSVRSLVRSLRRKLKNDYILNISGVGYKFIEL